MRDTFLLRVTNIDDGVQFYLATHHIEAMAEMDGQTYITMQANQEAIVVKEKLKDIFKILERCGVLTCLNKES